MKDNIHDIVDQVAEELEKNRRRVMIENYINQIAGRVQLSTEINFSQVSPNPQVEAEINTWLKTNRQDFAYKVSEAARIILRQELLGE